MLGTMLGFGCADLLLIMSSGLVIGEAFTLQEQMDVEMLILR
jgi:hypothetical protein